jgi:hypothetical protein
MPIRPALLTVHDIPENTASSWLTVITHAPYRRGRVNELSEAERGRAGREEMEEMGTIKGRHTRKVACSHGRCRNGKQSHCCHVAASALLSNSSVCSSKKCRTHSRSSLFTASTKNACSFREGGSDLTCSEECRQWAASQLPGST